MKQSILALGMIVFFTFSGSLQASTVNDVNSNNKCNDKATSKARSLFFEHYQHKHYAIAFDTLNLYVDNCPALFSTKTPSKQTLLLLSDFSLAVTRTSNPKACESVAALINVNTLRKSPSIANAVQTNLSLCSLKQTQFQYGMEFAHSECALDKNFLALPDSWQGRVNDYDGVQCIGPKILTKDEPLTVLKENVESKVIQIPLAGVIPNDDKMRVLFLGKERPTMVANIFNTEGKLQPETDKKRIESYSLRPYQTGKIVQQQIAILSKGMVQTESDNGHSKEYLTKLRNSIPADFTVDPYNWWGHKLLMSTDEIAGDESFLIAQYGNNIELVYNLGNDIKTLDLLTGEKETIFTSAETIYLKSIKGSLVYLANAKHHYFKLDLAAETLSLVQLNDKPIIHKGHTSNDSIQSKNEKRQINYNFSHRKMSVDSLFYTNLLIENLNYWGIVNISWEGDDEIYFDNTSAYACIWRANLTTREIERVIPIEAAVAPDGFRVGNIPYVVYIDRDKDQLYLATPMNNSAGLPLKLQK